MLTRVTSVVLSFVQGLVTEDEESRDEETIDSKGIIAPYAKDILRNLVSVLQTGI